MNREVRIGVVTAWPEVDWHSDRLVAVLSGSARVVTLAPESFSARVRGERTELWAGDEPARSLDAFVLVRGLGRVGDADLQFELYRALEDEGALVVNRLDALLSAQDKFRTSRLLARAGVPTPPSAVAQREEDALRVLAGLGDAVMKPVAGSLGDGVVRVHDDAAGRAAVRERAARDGGIYLQAWVEHPGRDARVFVVGGRARAAIARVAPPGEWRTNVAGGGEAEAVELSPVLASTAEAAALAVGLDYAGVDLVLGRVGAWVIEVNGNPSWRGILGATGLDMAEPIADHVLARALRRRGASAHIVSTGVTHGG
ncbi:MAG: RimK family alpha-L-glutamate ligase [Anaeromyxobacteraceae bacterium]